MRCEYRRGSAARGRVLFLLPGRSHVLVAQILLYEERPAIAIAGPPPQIASTCTTHECFLAVEQRPQLQLDEEEAEPGCLDGPVLIEKHLSTPSLIPTEETCRVLLPTADRIALAPDAFRMWAGREDIGDDWLVRSRQR